MCFVFIAFCFLSFSFSSHAVKDVVFVLDRSGSLDSQDVTDAIEFIHNVTEWLTIGTDDLQVSLVTFSDTVREEFNLGNFTNKTELLSTLDGLRDISSGGGTYTFDALNFVLTSSFDVTSGGRPDAEKAVVVITDGASTNLLRTLEMADQIRSDLGAEIYSIGIGSGQDEDELNGISNDPDSFYSLSVSDFIYLCNLIPAIVPKLDSEVNATLSESCPPIPTSAVSTTSTSTETPEQSTTEPSTTTESSTSTTIETTTTTTTDESTTTAQTTSTTQTSTTVTSTTEQTTTTTESLTTETTEVSTTTTEPMTTSTEEQTTTELTTTTEAATTVTTPETSTFITSEASTTTTTISTTSAPTSIDTTSIGITTESSNTKSEMITEKSSSTTGIIVGVLLGLLALLGFLFLLFCIRKKMKSNKAGPMDKRICINQQYSEASLQPTDMPRPLSYRRTSPESQKDTNGLLRESTTLSTFDVYV